MQWNHVREICGLAQEMRQEFPEESVADRVLAPITASRKALGMALACGGAAVADIAGAVRTRFKKAQ